MRIRSSSLALVACLLAILHLIATTTHCAETMAGTKVTFPSKVYLEDTVSGTALHFELGFKVKKACSPFLVTFKYLDPSGEALLYRRLVRHHIDTIARYTAVFDKANRVRHLDTKLAAGDFCFITHPYPEISWAKQRPATVACTVYLRATDGKGIELVEWKVKVRTYRATVALRLPCEGPWWHLEGHDSFSHHRQIFYHRNTNYFASDLMAVDEKLAICKGTGTRNEDFFSWGRKVLAMAQGKVVHVIRGIPDNPPAGRAKGFDPSKTECAGGNTVIIEHAKGLYGYYAHLAQGSVAVKKGQKIGAGQMLGRCGNSGNSDAPHIHVHLADAPALACLAGAGLPAAFARFQIKRGKLWMPVKDRALLAGEIVRHR